MGSPAAGQVLFRSPYSGSLRYKSRSADNGVRYRFKADRRRNDHMVEAIVIHISAEEAADVGCAAPFHLIHHPLDIRIRPHALAQALDSFMARREHANSKYVIVIAKNALAAPPHDHTFAERSGLADDLRTDLRHGLRVNNGGIDSRGDAFVTPLPQSLDQAVKPGVDRLVKAGGRLGVDLQTACNFKNQSFVNELPAQPVRQNFCNQAAAAAVFAADGNNVEHGRLSNFS